MTKETAETPPRKRLERDILWFAVGMIVVGVLGTVAFIGFLRGEVESQVRIALSNEKTIRSITSQPDFLSPLAATLVRDFKDALPQGEPGTAGQPGPFFGRIQEKTGNNGTAPCSRFCAGRQWGGFTGTCVGAKLVTGVRTGDYAGCDEAPGIGNELKCWCSVF